MTRKTVILIAGPTASGKTSLAISLARQLQTEIISADSRQCFRELNIGVAKPSPAELSEIRHHFINSHSIHDEVNAAVFEKYALQTAEDIFQTHDYAIMAGGTGLYIQAFCEGLDDMPSASPELRQQIIGQYKQRGLEWLQKEVERQDPLFYREGEIQNPRRLMRALEVKIITGRSIRELQQKKPVTRDFQISKYAIDIPRATLLRHIHARIDEMMQRGLLEEARTLLPYRSLPALQTVGYTELFAYLDVGMTLEAAIERIKINTTRYAKRQLTWFRNRHDFKWIEPPFSELWEDLGLAGMS